MTEPVIAVPATPLPRLPIIYLRGYAGATDSINQEVDDPFYGFNAGATHIRVGEGGTPSFYQFEGPLLRLMKDEGYQLLVQGSQQQVLTNALKRAALSGATESKTLLPAKSIWVFRFYDQAATTLQAQKPENMVERAFHLITGHTSAPGFDIETAGLGLYNLVQQVRTATGSEQVYLVAHSMGGLVARCMIQNISRQQGRTPGNRLVKALFTYGTPHGGIVTDLGAVNWIEKYIGPAGADIFSPSNMYKYLTPDDEQADPHVISKDVFDPDNIFCLIGTDPKDYSAVPRLAVGPRSDGLVRIENAYVQNAHRAFVHRSHSGRYGEVNSEEGYQNLRRFLFGRWGVTVDFGGLPVGNNPAAVWQADVRLAIRGLPVMMSEQRADQWSPIELNAELTKITTDDPDHPVPLLRTFLLDPGHLADMTGEPLRHEGRARYVLTLRVMSLHQDTGSFDFADHLEQVPDWAGSLIVDFGPDHTSPGPYCWAAWANDLEDANDDSANDPVTDIPLIFSGGGDGSRRATVPLPPTARSLEVFGPAATLRFTVVDRYLSIT